MASVYFTLLSGVFLERWEVRQYLGAVWWAARGGEAVVTREGAPPPALDLPPPRATIHLQSLAEASLADLKTASSHSAASSAINKLSR